MSTTTTGVLSYSLATAATATGLSKSHLLAAINRGEIKARRSSLTDDGDPTGKWVILADDLRAFLVSLPEG